MTLPQVASVWSSSEELLREAIANDGTLRLIGIGKCRSPFGAAVFVARVGLRDAAAVLPRALTTSSCAFVRVLDRFYLPESPDSAAATALFEDIAERYESLIDRSRNLSTIEALLRLCLQSLPDSSRLDILDFGCGSGLSALALRRLGPRATTITLVGTDASLAMIARAGRAGLTTTPLQTVLAEGYRCDAVFASYVLHLGVDTGELTTVCRSIRPGGVFVGNWFHGTPEKLLPLQELLRDVGERVDVLPAPAECGPILRVTIGGKK